MLNRMSKHRNILKGIAILGVIAVHSGYEPTIHLIRGIKGFGYVGVDLFMLVSGFGVYCSLFRNDNIMDFYRRRIIGIFPAFIPVLLVKFFVIDISASDISSASQILPMFYKTLLGNIFGYAFFTGVGYPFNWYINTILWFYLFAPIIYRLIRHRAKHMCILLISIAFLISFPFLGTGYAIAILRFPIFILGICLGHMYKNEVMITYKTEILICVLGIILFAALSCKVMLEKKLDNDILMYYPFFIIIPAGIIIITKAAEILEKCAGG